jgi:hypothetical protein
LAQDAVGGASTPSASNIARRITAFSVFDRVRTGELAPWHCFLCARELYGTPRLSVLAFIERTLGEPVPTKPALVSPICRFCDSTNTEETRRRVDEELDRARNPDTTWTTRVAAGMTARYGVKETSSLRSSHTGTCLRPLLLTDFTVDRRHPG